MSIPAIKIEHVEHMEVRRTRRRKIYPSKEHIVPMTAYLTANSHAVPQ